MSRSIRVSLLVVAALVAVAVTGWVLWFAVPADRDSGQVSEVSGPSYRAGNLRVGVALDGPEPRTGENRLVVTLRDEDGNPVDDASVEAEARMPAMGAMPEMRAPVEFEASGPGVYRGMFTLNMDGSWPLTLRVRRPGMDDAELRFDMATGREGLRLTSGAEREAGEVSAGEPGEALGNAITVDARRRQLIGLRTGTVERRSLTRNLRLPGEVVWDETGLREVTLRVDGWVGELFADTTGMAVQRGEPLFTVYGPELLAVQQEYLTALRRASRTAADGAGLLEAARRRLTLWGLSEEQIRQLEERGEPLDYLPVLAPADGIVIDKPIVAGSAVPAGEPFLRIADLSRVWVEARVHDADLSVVRQGMNATITFPHIQDRAFEARVDYIYPSLDADTRSGRIRLELDNPGATLRPEMYAAVTVQAELGERLVVPANAVLIAGQLRVVFLDIGNGRLRPVRVTTGQRVDGYVEILDGLEAGDEIVTSGVFLVASESQLQGGLQQW
ncbi:MAG: FixH family protein [Pseudohongiellaceae bacterium]